MIHECLSLLREWNPLDTWIAVTAMLAAMACSLPGCFLLLRRQSMMGDALSHTSLLGVTIGALLAIRVVRWGWIPVETMPVAQHFLVLGGAMLVGIFSAALTEAIQKLGGVDAGAALGVVFTVLFAAGLLLMRLAADESHLDADCVLYGAVETAYVGDGVPQAAVLCAGMLVFNLLATLVFYKELRVSAFDQGFATSIGIPARWMHYALISVTAATVVAAFEAVGTILVIAMLIVPAATAHLLTDRLWKMIATSLLVATLSAWLGHAAAIALPGPIFLRLGFDSVRSASSAGMIAVMSGVLFGVAALFGPQHGLIARWWVRTRLTLRIAAEDVLGLLYRCQEPAGAADPVSAVASPQAEHRFPRGVFHRLAIRWLVARGEVAMRPQGLVLTESGRTRASLVVRSHRLWESYLAKHFPLQDDHLHEAAALVEHYLTPEIREAIVEELAAPVQDPHGRQIPDEPLKESGS